MVETVSEIIEKSSPYYAKIKEKKGKIRRDSIPAEEHKLVYNSTSETLEPVYFWILDLMNSFFKGDVEKLVDNFTSTPGGGHFAELGQRATVMQQQGMNMMAQINTVIKSIINLIYDLKEFQIRLEHYRASHSKKKEEKEAAVLALKQMWMDNVDIKRGRGSINMLAQDLNFVTIRDAFMVVDSVEDIDKKDLDLNERVKRILKPRMQEFLEWKTRSETELKKRYEIERSYLKSQVNSLKLYTRWAKPYLVAAEKLRMQEMGREPALVNTFNTILLQLTLFAKNKIDIQSEAIDRNLPEDFKKLKLKRDYYPCVLIDFVFRGIPSKISPQAAHYAFGGRVDVIFKGYCLNEDELTLLDDKLGESDIADALNLIEGTTTESLDELREDIEDFLKGEEKESEEIEKRAAEDVNPFSALFGIGKGGKRKSKEKDKVDKEKDKEKEKIKKLKEKGIREDNYTEGMVRALGEQAAKETCFKIFDIYKKAHGMESHPSPY